MEMKELQEKLMNLINEEEKKPAKNKDFILECVKECIKAEGIRMSTAAKLQGKIKKD